jgi:hypothetical protein
LKADQTDAREDLTLDRIDLGDAIQAASAEAGRALDAALTP